MLTPLTQAAIALLSTIYIRRARIDAELSLSEQDENALLQKMEDAGLIYHTGEEQNHNLCRYKLARSPYEISLLDILEATGEHLNCNHPTGEEFYLHYGRTAQKLGVVNQMTRLYLQEIKLLDL